jgi:hypothetical protein
MRDGFSGDAEVLLWVSGCEGGGFGDGGKGIVTFDKWNSFVEFTHKQLPNKDCGQRPS